MLFPFRCLRLEKFKVQKCLSRRIRAILRPRTWQKLRQERGVLEVEIPVSAAEMVLTLELNLERSPHVTESRTVLDSGFHAVDSGFRVLDSGFQHSGFRIPKRSIPFFFRFNAFLRTLFRVRILLYWKTLLEGITSLFSLSIYKITERNVLQFRKGLWYNNEGDIGRLSTPQHRRKKITSTASPQKNVGKHRHRNLKFCPTINLIQISM